MKESDAPFDRWHKKYPKPDQGDLPCTCGTRKNPLYPSGDHGRGQRWQARYTDPNGNPRRPTFNTWQEARDHLDEVRVAIRNDRWVDPQAGKETVDFYAKQMMERRDKREANRRTIETYRSHLKCHILPFIGKRRARTLKRSDSMQFVDYLIDRSGLKSKYTIRAVFGTWRVLMYYMVDEDVPLPANIVARITLPDVKPRVDVALSSKQVTALAAAMKEIEPRYEILIWIAACAGLRQGEAFGLKYSAVNWSEGLLSVEEQRQGGQATQLKTESSYATLPVDRFLLERLAEHKATHPRIAPVHKETVRRRQARGYVAPPDEGLVVTNRYGRPVQRTDFMKKWKQAVKLAGLPSKTRYHDLKHFYTSQLGASGQHDPKTVQRLSRHAQFTQTWNTYAHPPLAVEGVAVTVFSSIFDTSP